MRRMYTALLWRHAAAQLRLYGAVVLFVDDVVHTVAVYEQILHRVAEILGGIVGYVEQFSVLREHHQEARESLKLESSNMLMVKSNALNARGNGPETGLQKSWLVKTMPVIA